jgi:glycogen(starch) synthase
MHILMTADAVGGVWTYTQELVSGLVRRGHRVTLVSFGKLPSAKQIEWVKPLASLEYQPTSFRLEWMQDAAQDLGQSAAYLGDLVHAVQPDVLHFNQFAYGALECDVPRVVVAHSDVVSWWQSVHQQEPPGTEWMRWYRRVVSKGLARADAVVAPSQFMLRAVRQNYLGPDHGEVIHNGRTAELFEPDCDKENVVLSVGRLWDRAKQVSLLGERKQCVPVWIAGELEHPDRAVSGRAGRNTIPDGVNFCGRRSHKELRTLYARAAIYAATSCYEPFGLAPLEAALSHCALILNDIPVFRELWGNAAFYFHPNDPASLAEAIRLLAADSQMRNQYAERAHEHARSNFDSQRMIVRYEHLYRELAAGRLRRKHEAAA